jgi:hypothetical protein
MIDDTLTWKTHIEMRTPKLSSACYRGGDKSLARPTSRCILFDGENILFDASLIIYI